MTINYAIFIVSVFFITHFRLEESVLYININPFKISECFAMLGEMATYYNTLIYYLQTSPLKIVKNMIAICVDMLIRARKTSL